VYLFYGAYYMLIKFVIHLMQNILRGQKYTNHTGKFWNQIILTLTRNNALSNAISNKLHCTDVVKGKKGKVVPVLN
jgi:hypothetical protein